MPQYTIRPANEGDIQFIAEIYNSNPRFLLSHLGMVRIDEGFAASEMENMKKAGFLSCVIADAQHSRDVGVLDYRPGREAYLSLLMLASELQGRGAGSRIYLSFEQMMRRSGCTSIRIDVVNDYPGHLVSFWKKLGFLEEENIVLNWGKKNSRAVVMRKTIQ